MVGVEDIFAHIVQELQVADAAVSAASTEEFLAGLAFNIRLSITDSLEETELDYLNRFGKGHTFYFRLANYEHGKLLAGQIYWIMLGKRPDLALHDGHLFEPGKQLYLFVYVKTMEPPRMN